MAEFASKNIESHSELLLLRHIVAWFDSKIQAWNWYTNQKLSAFNRLTPSEVVQRYGNAGIIELQKWIAEREMGGFQ